MTDESKEEGRGEGEGGEGSADLIRFLANELRNIKSGPITVMFTRGPRFLFSYFTGFPIRDAQKDDRLLKYLRLIF